MTRRNEHEHEHEHEARITVVLSPPRTGSSWFGRVLDQDPSLQVVRHDSTQTYLFYAAHPLGSLLPRHDDRLRAGPSSAALVKRLRRGWGSSHAGIVIASPTALLIAHEVLALPGARAIVLERDTEATVRSLKGFWQKRSNEPYARRAQIRGNGASRTAAVAVAAHAFHRWRWQSRGYIGVRPPGFQARYCGAADVDFCAWYLASIRKEVEDAVSSLPTERILPVRYDDLLEDPAGGFAAVARFVGSTDPDALSKVAATMTKPPGKTWTPEDLSTEESAWLAARFGGER